MDLVAAQVERLAHHFVDAVGDPARVRGPVDVVEPHGEFVAGVAGERVPFAQAGLEPPGDLHQELIAGLVPVGVVDGLEPVDVDEENRKSVVGVPADAVERVAEQVEEEGAVRQPGERVVPGVVRHPLDELAVAGDVGEQADQAHRHPGGVAHHRAAHLDPFPVPRGVAHAVLVLELPAASG
jgi:hypothetical protein